MTGPNSDASAQPVLFKANPLRQEDAVSLYVDGTEIASIIKYKEGNRLTINVKSAEQFAALEALSHEFVNKSDDAIGHHISDEQGRSVIFKYGKDESIGSSAIALLLSGLKAQTHILQHQGKQGFLNLDEETMNALIDFVIKPGVGAQKVEQASAAAFPQQHSELNETLQQRAGPSR